MPIDTCIVYAVAFCSSPMELFLTYLVVSNYMRSFVMLKRNSTRPKKDQLERDAMDIPFVEYCKVSADARREPLKDAPGDTA